MKKLDMKERRCNLVVSGLPQYPDEIGETDNEEVVMVLQTTGYSNALEPVRWEMKRLGQDDERRKRSLFIKMDTQMRTDVILRAVKI